MSSSLTQVRDLRTGTPPWGAYGVADVPSHRLAHPITTDVVMVGAGITGALLASTLAETGVDTIILDRRPPGRGSTAASTALLQFEIDTPLMHLADQIGMPNAAQAWRRSYRAVADLAATVTRLGLACDFRPRTALYLPGDVLGAGGIAEEGRLRRAIGLPSAFLSARELAAHAGIDRSAALLSHGAADVNPLQLTIGLLGHAVRNGGHLFTPAELAEVVPLTNRVEMVTTDGIELQARALVFATGYELAAGVPSEGHHHTSTWAFATPPQPQKLWPHADLIWEAADPYIYIRTTRDGRVIVGGEDEDLDDEAARDRLLPAKTAALQVKLAQLFPGIDVSADFAWAGTFGASDTGLPSIGAVPGMSNCYAVLGYGGNGITFGVVAAGLIRNLICGENDPETDLFAFR